MKSEIGSEFWLEEVPKEVPSKMPEWLKKFGEPILTQSGRGAISLLLENIKPKKKTVLIPEYICESVIQPFIEYGYHCDYYEINSDLSINLESIKNINEVGVFFHLGYYGFPTNSNLVDVLIELKKNSVVIIEDVTHSLFSTTERYRENDYYIGSVRKWFGVPSGGFIAASKGIDKCLLTPINENEKISNLRKEALIDKGQYMLNKNIEKKDNALKKFSKAENLLNKDFSPYMIDKISENILSAIDIQELTNKRVENFTELSRGLSSLEIITPIFKGLDRSVCPIFYPVIVNINRNELRRKLAAEKIYCPVHWPLPLAIEEKYLSDTTMDIYDHILSIPCDQRYGINDMKRIVSLFEYY